MNSHNEIRSNFINYVSSNSYKLTPREEKGFLFEGETSESVFSSHVNHDELPHLFRRDFKKNISKGVDFRLSVNGYKVMIEAKKWKYAYEPWLHNVTDRFMGKNNYGDINICVVANIHSSGFFKFRHILKQYGIILLADYELPWFLYKLMRRGIKLYINYYTKDVKFRVREGSKKNKQYIKQFFIFSDNSDNCKINDSVEDTMEIRLTLEHNHLSNIDRFMFLQR